MEEEIKVSQDIQCGECGKDMSKAFETILEELEEVDEVTAANKGSTLFADSRDEEDRLSELKSLVKLQELGISLEYRCPSCRDCSSCRNAPTTERVSLREEAEDQAIKDSIKVDFEAKKITCSLPLRGKEEDFLSNNRAIALKVLDSQCKKVEKDEEAKKAVIKSFYKLFDPGPVRFPAGPKDLMVKVEQTFDAFFRLWNSTMVPKLIPQPKWFRESPELQPEDVVYFQKVDNVLSSKWTVGQVDSLVRSKDGVVRRAFVRYYNHNENEARFTDRAVRSLVKIFNVEDNYFIRDMSEVETLMKTLEEKAEGEPSDDNHDVDEKTVKPTKLKKDADGTYHVQHAVDVDAVKPCGCCCVSHCKMNEHKEVRGKMMYVSLVEKDGAMVDEEVEFPNIYERDLFTGTFDDDAERSGLVVDSQDEIYDILTSLETKFDLD